MSPSEDGLKVVFELKKRCYDAGQYSVFYKAFCKSFAEQYGLNQVIDSVTCDVTRACFLSVDKDAYYNPFADQVDLQQFVSTENVIDFLDLKRQQEFDEKNRTETVEPSKNDVSQDIIAQIKAKLNHKVDTPQRDVYVPRELDEIMDGLTGYVEAYDMNVIGIKNIQYGKQISCSAGVMIAEMNLFYGKHGFKYVASVKSGTNLELNQVLTSVVRCYVESQKCA